MKGQMVADMRNAVRSEVGKALQSQQTLLTDQLEAMRSQAATPAPDSQSNIKNIMVCLYCKCKSKLWLWVVCGLKFLHGIVLLRCLCSGSNQYQMDLSSNLRSPS